MKQALLRLSAMVTAPRATLLRIARQDEGDFFDVLVSLAALRLLLNVPALYKAVLLFPSAPGPVFRRVMDDLWGDLRHDLFVFCGAAFVFVLLGRLVVKPPLAARSAITAVAFAAVPYLYLLALSSIVGQLGLAAWWLPHHPVDAVYALFTEGRISMGRYAIKCVINYSLPLALLLDLLRQLRAGAEPAASSAEGPAGGRRALIGAAMAAVLIAGVAGTGVWRTARAEKELRPLIPGDELPAATLPYLKAGRKTPVGELDLATLRGNVLVIDFWASWCAPCMRELPELSALQKKLGPEGLQIIGINREPRARAEARAAWERLDPSFPSLIDEAANTRGGYGERIGIQSLPTTLVVDKEGIVRHLHLGYTAPEVFEKELAPLLAQPDP